MPHYSCSSAKCFTDITSVLAVARLGLTRTTYGQLTVLERCNGGAGGLYCINEIGHVLNRLILRRFCPTL